MPNVHLFFVPLGYVYSQSNLFMMRTYLPLSIFFMYFFCFILQASAEFLYSDSIKTRLSIPSKSVLAPYKIVSGGKMGNHGISSSPDPMVNYYWENEDADLQVYHLRPTSISVNNEHAFENAKSLLHSSGKITVNGVGELCFDFGTESAAWLEFDSPDFNGDVEMSISEYNQPGVFNLGPQAPTKTAKPVKHGNTYRLELNKALYEGVRFGWIHVKAIDKPWHITDVRLVCQTKPANYKGYFESSSVLLNRMWYTGAYAVKLNLLKDHLGAILIDRGDRYSWTGDAYVSQGVSMLAFGNYDLIKENLKRTAKDDNAIESYSLLWIHSLLDYYKYSGDEAFFREHLSTIDLKITHAAEVIEKQSDLGFYGWDERIGAGFEDPNNPESRAAYQLLYIQTCNILSPILKSLGQNEAEEKYMDAAIASLSALKSDVNRWSKIGIHAATEAINGGYLSDLETKAMLERHFVDDSQIVSFSPFNQYFIIRAMAKEGWHEQALHAIDLCWGGQLRLGATTFWECYRPEWEAFLKPHSAVPNGQHGYTSLCHP